MSKQQIGVIGMAVMGRNLALNLDNRGYSVSVFNRSNTITNAFLKKTQTKMLEPHYTIQTFLRSLEKPRCIMLMVKAGEATDSTISSLIPYLDPGDILIDGGNAFYKDTMRRQRELSTQGVYLIGTGVSGGERGALVGPSFMPGGHKEAYAVIEPIFTKIAALSEGKACVSYIGPDGSGHYVKMVHNGIEYADMQLIAEAYSLLKDPLNFNNETLAQIFSDWNQGELNSYLIGITKDILTKTDKDGNYILDLILDEAAHKGTGQWTSQSALDLNEPVSLITASVFARYLSLLKSQRIEASTVLSGPKLQTISINRDEYIETVRKALYLGKIIAYAQGFSQLKSASTQYNWQLKYGEIANIFRAGCIIRAGLLQEITNAYKDNANISNLILAPYFKSIANKYQKALRDVVAYSVLNGIPTPTFSAAISYYDSYRAKQLPANLIQAQRDYFGSHTYQRIDKSGIFHTEW
ncbi:6-phosphogluconate dehydrogenase, decarboxylating [Candidatus Erwinia haradaeae]|uniref:6-phosphogluconate dehydrogenase, decarboxylating n=1 Tax=Candidatus Erwinia haradaeae TaxID=1922217 RepID=A0A451DJ52_9GAMM|nr:NADP-dependent phosphogluconate dehydrogenase [Candidatus Erwinia haradaeae]VFP86713.1 6-phosphogluconate dehydrogenase, decarboxylating [Candidatus Erwinia haradaeae]